MYDRVDPLNYGSPDVDLIVSSLAASNFYLRSNTNSSKKVYVTVNDKTIPYDLRNPRSYYYPLAWIQNIQKHTLHRYNDILPIAQPMDRLMLGLYHFHIHKNGDPKNLSIDRRRAIENLASDFGIDNPYDIDILNQFLSQNMYNVRCCTDSGVGCNIVTRY